MRFNQIGDILDWARKLHEHLAEDYQSFSEQHSQQRVGLLLEYLSEHERALAKAIESYEQDAAHRLLSTWHDGVVEVDLPDSLEGLSEELDCSSTEQVLNLAIQFHDQLIVLYETLSSEAPTPSVAELFDNLSSMEVREKMRTVRDALRLEDL